jgi:hypothetical protein
LPYPHIASLSLAFLFAPIHTDNHLPLIALGEALSPSKTQHPDNFGGESMYRMDKLTTGIAYGASATNTGYWLLQLTDKVSPSQWAAIGVIGSLVFGLLTYLTNLYFKIKEDRRKAARGE